METVFNDLVEDLKTFIRRNGLSYEEYHRAVEFIAQAGTAGEVPLLMDVFLEAVVDDVNYGGRPGTESNIEGPYYVPGAPFLERPYVLPQRENEEGENPAEFGYSVGGAEASESAGFVTRDQRPSLIRAKAICRLSRDQAGHSASSPLCTALRVRVGRPRSYTHRSLSFNASMVTAN